MHPFSRKAAQLQRSILRAGKLARSKQHRTFANPIGAPTAAPRRSTTVHALTTEREHADGPPRRAGHTRPAGVKLLWFRDNLPLGTRVLDDAGMRTLVEECAQQRPPRPCHTAGLALTDALGTGPHRAESGDAQVPRSARPGDPGHPRQPQAWAARAHTVGHAGGGARARGYRLRRRHARYVPSATTRRGAWALRRGRRGGKRADASAQLACAGGRIREQRSLTSVTRTRWNSCGKYKQRRPASRHTADATQATA